MMGRHLRTNLPTLGVKLRPSLPNPDVVKDTDKATKLGYEHYYNACHGVRSLPDLQPGDVVKLKTDPEKSWATKGIVTATAESPRSYIVQSESGVFRRNRRHLQTTADTEPSLPIPAPTAAPTATLTTVQPDHTLPAVVTPPSPAPVTPQLRRSSRTITKPDRSLSTWVKNKARDKARIGAVYSLFTGCLFAMFANCCVPLQTFRSRKSERYSK